MTARNDITGDLIKSKTLTDSYSKNWDIIFGNKNKKDNNANTDNKEKTENNSQNNQ